MNKIVFLDLLPNIDVSCTAFKVQEGVLKWSKSDRNDNFSQNKVFTVLTTNTFFRLIIIWCSLQMCYYTIDKAIAFWGLYFLLKRCLGTTTFPLLFLSVVRGCFYMYISFDAQDVGYKQLQISLVYLITVFTKVIIVQTNVNYFFTLTL